MALTEIQFPGRKLTLAIASLAAGDPVLLGALTGVATNATQADGNVVVDTAGIHNLSVKGVITGPANSAVAIGDALYYNAGHTPKIDKDVGGTLFGYAMATVGSGSTATIAVKLKTV